MQEVLVQCTKFVPMKTRERILDRALEMFNEFGIHRTGIRSLARSMGMSPGNLSYHFPRREDLILGLLERFKMINDRIIAGYRSENPDLESYMEMQRSLFHERYNYRGLFAGQLEIKDILVKEYDYARIERTRRASIFEMLGGLEECGDLLLGESNRGYMVDFLSFFNRFWLMEASLSYSDESSEEVVDRYLERLAKQWNLFATDQGEKKLRRFFSGPFC